jgi:hypothetical protein
MGFGFHHSAVRNRITAYREAASGFNIINYSTFINAKKDPPPQCRGDAHL